MSRARAICVVALLCGALPARSADDAPVRTLIMGVRAAAESDEGVAFAASEVVQGVYLKDEGRVVLGRADVAGVATLQSDQAMLACEGQRCLSELAQALDAPRVVTGSIARTADAFELELVESNAEGIVIARVRARAHLTKQALLDETRAAARELVAQTRKVADAPRAGARVLVRTIPAGAEVEVDGAAWGRSPALATGLTGPKAVVVVRGRDGAAAVVQAPVFADDVTVVEVAMRVPPELTPDARAQRESDRWWELGLGGAKLAGGAACCCASVCPGAAAAILATTPGVPGTSVAENVAQVAVCAVPAVGAVLAGLGLTTWGVVDIVPRADLDVHRATIIPPPGRGDATVIELPVDDVAR